MKKRWTPELLEEVKELRYKKLWTLQQIADKYGVTRARIHGVLGYSTGGRKLTSKIKRMLLDDVSGLTLDEMSKKYNLNKQTISNAFGKKMYLQPVITYLKAHGLSVEKDTHKKGSYLIVNNHSVHVSFAHRQSSPKINIVSPIYTFSVYETEKMDFSLLCITNTMDMFIIPKEEMKGKRQIRFVWDQATKEKSLMSKKHHFQKYYKRFDLLR